MTVVSLNLPDEAGLRFNQLSNSKKEELIRLVTAFVAPPERDIRQVMDDMAEYAKAQGLTEEILDEILNEI